MALGEKVVIFAFTGNPEIPRLTTKLFYTGIERQQTSNEL